MLSIGARTTLTVDYSVTPPSHSRRVHTRWIFLDIELGFELEKLRVRDSVRSYESSHQVDIAGMCCKVRDLLGTFSLTMNKSTSIYL